MPAKVLKQMCVSVAWRLVTSCDPLKRVNFMKDSVPVEDTAVTKASVIYTKFPRS